MQKRNRTNQFLYYGIVTILVLLMVLSGLQILESTFLKSEETVAQPVHSKTIERDGVEYFPRQDITVLMVLGIDKKGPVEHSGSYNNDGANDVVMLMIFDEKNEEYSVLYLNRDTMLQMPVLGIGGKYAGTAYGQLALAHSYGSGLEDSCENTRKTVSDFLYGLNIDYYLSMNLDAIGILNDSVGGVTVEVVDDFSQVDPSLTLGTHTLNSEQALRFIQSRIGVGDHLNISRNRRQKDYMIAFSEAFQAKMATSTSFAMNVYQDISPYIVTDCSGNVMTSMMSRYGAYELKEIVTPEGQNIKGDVYMEFYVDEEKLDELILRLFYSPK